MLELERCTDCGNLILEPPVSWFEGEPFHLGCVRKRWDCAAGDACPENGRRVEEDEAVWVDRKPYHVGCAPEEADYDEPR